MQLAMLSTCRFILLVIFVACIALVPLQAQVVISQVYGGGGNAGATYTNDFVEVFNRGSATVSLAGWSVQYGSSAGTSSWIVTALSGSIAPGQYFLIQEAAGTGGTTPLPSPNVIGTISMAAGAAKVALVSSTTALSGACPSSASIQDVVGYGAANCSETSPAPALTNTTAALRANAGCTDTGNNSADFTAVAPAPRNTSTPNHSCGLGISNNSPLPDAKVGNFYSVTFAGSGGTGTGYTFSLLSGTLPPGLTLSAGVL
ncbi:MAG TPA: lamin tail domain-containing protein, partial [Terriglobales bacterium]